MPPTPTLSTVQAFNGQALTEVQLTDSCTTKLVIINSAHVIFSAKLGMGRTKAQLIKWYHQLVQDKGLAPSTIITPAPV
jgi:hypothetical protein